MLMTLTQTVGVRGWDGCIGYSAWVGKPAESDSALVRLLRDAGAVPFVKTNVPITLLSFESASDVFGRTTNPHRQTHSPGGSSGGEATLLAYGGSRIGIGTDVAGSVRVPAHYSGGVLHQSICGTVSEDGEQHEHARPGRRRTCLFADGEDTGGSGLFLESNYEHAAVDV